jgi:tRNA-(ms[2]io[6]A)-hydroxylase
MDIAEKKVLGLQLPTDPRWVDLAAMNIGDILSDHAWCEQKAATTCISLIIRYSDTEELVKQLSPVVTEEWGHFRMVLRELGKRGLKLGRQRKDEYVNELLKLVRKDTPNHILMDNLLISALIEARSCERFRLLSLEIPDESLRGFYHDLMVAEASHYRMFIDLAASLTGEEASSQRWKKFLREEANIMQSMEPRSDRMH